MKCKQLPLYHLLCTVGGRERSYPGASAGDVLHRVPRFLPRGLPLLRKAGDPVLHTDQNCDLYVEGGRR